MLHIFALLGGTAMRSTWNSIGLRKGSLAENCALTCSFYGCIPKLKHLINLVLVWRCELKFGFSYPRKQTRSVLRDEDDTDTDCDDSDTDFDMDEWKGVTSNIPDEGNFFYLRVIGWEIQVDSWRPNHLPIPLSPSSGGEQSTEAAKMTKAEQATADREQAWVKQLKAITWPEMDEDGLPSSYVTKVLGVTGKWQIKMSELSKSMACFDDDCVSQFLWKSRGY